MPQKPKKSRAIATTPTKARGLIVLTTVSSKKQARYLAGELVARRAAACVNLIPGVESIYRWEGKIERANEIVLLIKTTARAFHKVRDTLAELHSYDCAECIAIDIPDGSEPYLAWLAAACDSGMGS